MLFVQNHQDCQGLQGHPQVGGDGGKALLNPAFQLPSCDPPKDVTENAEREFMWHLILETERLIGIRNNAEIIRLSNYRRQLKSAQQT